jgi:DNA-binding transcriptional regulator YiaG
LWWVAARWASRTGADGRPRGAHIWRTLADASFGIYLVHPLFITFALTYLAPFLPSAVPAPLRIAFVWLFAVVTSSALSIALMRTPLLSRLVGRATPLPESLKAWSRRRWELGAPAIPLPAGVVPEATRTSMAPAVAPAVVAQASSSLSRGVVPTEPETEQAAPRITRVLPRVAIAAHSGVLRAVYSDALELPDADAGNDGEMQTGRASNSLAANTRVAREERRQRARELREQGWKQKDIAAALGVSRSTVSQWLRRTLDAGSSSPASSSASHPLIGTDEREAVIVGR